VIRGSLGDLKIIDTNQAPSLPSRSRMIMRDRAFPKGVSKTYKGRYTAAIRLNASKTKHLGTFRTPGEAHEAYLLAEAERDNASNGEKLGAQ
jgi:hypothetical protein